MNRRQVGHAAASTFDIANPSMVRLQLFGVGEVFGIACEEGDEDVGIDVGSEKLHGGVAHAEITSADVETEDLFVIRAIHHAYAASIMHVMPVFVLCPTVAALGFLRDAPCGEDGLQSLAVPQWPSSGLEPHE